VTATVTAPAAPVPGDRAALRLALVAGQLLVLLAAVWIFRLENRTVFWLLAAAVAGFVVHAHLPPRYRLVFFGLLSLASVIAVLGPEAGLVLIGAGYALIGACHLPVGFKTRAAILLAVAVGLMLLRDAAGLGVLPALVLPVLGSMFMFRLILYLMAVHHGQAPRGLAWATAYLFMLPNVCYPLFPVVDFNTFVRGHFDAERFRVYERGVQLMLRGILQLLVYRVVYYGFAMDGLYVNDLRELAVYVVSTFLLYVKISGEFWLIIGLLGLYGFRLPETNHLYFLASSPNDFWRRINIYWKDFMVKLAYYPSFFALRRFGNLFALLAGTGAVFAVTWALHGYQFYWLRGGGLLTKRDLAFWGAFAVLVLGTTLWEQRRRKSRMRKTDRSWSLTRGVSTVATFVVIAVLWSLWNSHSLATWLFMWTRARYATPGTWIVLLALLVPAVALAGYAWGAPKLEVASPAAEPLAAVARRAAGRVAIAGCLAALTLSAVRSRLPLTLGETVDHLQDRGFAAITMASEQLGYYEALTGGGGRAGVPWQPPLRREREWGFMVPRSDFLHQDWPASRSTVYDGAPLSTNSWGMRDGERTLAKPAGTYRIALFGPSDVAGEGVADDQTFASLTEARLDSAERAAHRRVEILNFGQPGTSLAQQVWRLEQQGLRFSPDLIVLTVHPFDLAFLQQSFSTAAEDGYPIPDTGLARVVASVGIGPGLGGNPANLRLVEGALDRRLFRWAQELGARVGATVAVLALRTADVDSPGNLPTTRRALAAADIPLIDCTHVWDGRRQSELRISDEDSHPNAAGHRLIADCLYQGLARHARQLRIRPLALIARGPSGLRDRGVDAGPAPGERPDGPPRGAGK
jgi:hypothetical protein